MKAYLKDPQVTLKLAVYIFQKEGKITFDSEDYEVDKGVVKFVIKVGFYFYVFLFIYLFYFILFYLFALRLKTTLSATELQFRAFARITRSENT